MSSPVMRACVERAALSASPHRALIGSPLHRMLTLLLIFTFCSGTGGCRPLPVCPCRYRGARAATGVLVRLP
ncbi:hypothetical protein, partial [Actinoplanes nipponensis]